MADSKITALTSISTSTDPVLDQMVIVDVSDTSMAGTGTTKKVSLNQLLAASPTATLASATITGDLTVDTSTLKVDSANNRVGIGTASPGLALDIVGSTRVTYGQSYNSFTSGGSNSPMLSCQIWNAVGNIVVLQNPFSDVVIGSSTTGTSTERYRIAADGVATWSNVGGVAGTAMTLNSTGLGVGRSPSAWNALYKGLVVGGTSGNTIVLAGNDASIGTGYYLSGAGIYNRDNGSATVSSINMYNRAFVFRTAAAGAVDSAITWTDSMTLDASGNLLVGTTSSLPSFANGRIEVLSAASSYCMVADATAASAAGIGIRGNDSTVAASFYNASTGGTVGSIVINSGGVSYNTTSDYRLKESIKPISGGLARVNALKPSVYNWKSNGSSGEGFLAHELAEVVPAAVTGEKDAVNEDGSIKAQSIDMSRVVPVLVAAIQELAARVQTLETR